MLGPVTDNRHHDHADEHLGYTNGVSQISSIVPTRNSESTATTAVAMSRMKNSLANRPLPAAFQDSLPHRYWKKYL